MNNTIETKAQPTLTAQDILNDVKAYEDTDMDLNISNLCARIKVKESVKGGIKQ